MTNGGRSLLWQALIPATIYGLALELVHSGLRQGSSPAATAKIVGGALVLASVTIFLIAYICVVVRLIMTDDRERGEGKHFRRDR